MAKAWALVAALALAACAPDQDGRNGGTLDLTPPALVGATAVAPAGVEMRFSEPVSLVAGSLSSQPPLELTGSRAVDCSLMLDLGPQTPGLPYLVELNVSDARGNTAHLLVRVYGFNPDVPAVLINELTVRGSATHPDIVELRVGSAGNMGGLVVCNGTAGSWTSRIVFPAFAVAPGDFVLVHFKPQGLSAEIDETEDKTLSGGLDASPGAFDLWVPEATGLNGNNGVIALYARVGGPVLDAILYSNRTSASDATYAGFGTAETLQRATEIVEAGGWRADFATVRPEDAVNPEASTSTRSICRRRGVDTDSRADWYIVPTRGATFGAENLEDDYKP